MDDRPPNRRALDAAINRAGEGLRVVEDFVRFHLDDPLLTRMAKALRHDLTAATARFSPAERLASRDTRRDVGTKIATVSERTRLSPAAVCSANMKRVQQALRSVEEFGKLASEESAILVEKLRYSAYTLEKCIGGQIQNRDRLAEARLYILIDGGDSTDDFSTRASTLVACGADVIQLRDKRLGDRDLVDRARALVAATRGNATLAIINDRADVAAVSGADGVHVGQDEMTIRDAHNVVGPDSLVGASIHSTSQAEDAILEGADYLGVGPVFRSVTKSFAALPGLPLVESISKMTKTPWFAIGGIAPENCSAVVAAGASRVAISAAIARADPPAAVVSALREQLGCCPPTPQFDD